MKTNCLCNLKEERDQLFKYFIQFCLYFNYCIKTQSDTWLKVTVFILALNWECKENEKKILKKYEVIIKTVSKLNGKDKRVEKNFFLRRRERGGGIETGVWGREGTTKMKENKWVKNCRADENDIELAEFFVSEVNIELSAVLRCISIFRSSQIDHIETFKQRLSNVFETDWANTVV